MCKAAGCMVNLQKSIAFCMPAMHSGILKLQSQYHLQPEKQKMQCWVINQMVNVVYMWKTTRHIKEIKGLNTW